MNKIIGITSSKNEKGYALNCHYTKAIENSGGMPLIIPYEWEKNIDILLSKVDGLIFSGGGDIHSSFFQEELHPKADCIIKERDSFEIELLKNAITKNIPILAICRGTQILNVATGGNIFQHIEGHNFSENRFEAVHAVFIEDNTLLKSIVNKNCINVNSIHHQVIGNKLGKDVIVTAKDGQGNVEAIEIINRKFVLGVQWHPEALYEDDFFSKAIFKAFISAC